MTAREPDDLKDRRKNLKNGRLPHIAALFNGESGGLAYVVPFRKRPAYRYAVEALHLCASRPYRPGIGRHLMQGLVDACAAAGFRQMIGISTPTTACPSPCTSGSASSGGLLPGVAYRFGRWADTVMVQRAIGPAPPRPRRPAR